MRSAWDYAERWADFLGWAERLAAVENPLSVLRFGVDKERYLPALAAAGVPVVPTEFVHPGEPFGLPASRSSSSLRSRPGGGARPGSRPATARGARDGDPRGRGDGDGPAVLQGAAESSLVYVDGQYSHSLSRRAELPLGRRRRCCTSMRSSGP